MSKKKKSFFRNKLRLAGLGLIILVLAGYAAYNYTSLGKGERAAEERSAASKGEKNLEKLFPNNMEEEAVQQAIHDMSHQKVKAENKWGALQVTPDRISRLLSVVEANEMSYKHSSVYLDILERWNEGDFSSAARDHNRIWKLQGGTVGEAKGLLSKEEEQKYIEKNFK
ncbi:DUF6241 domain-containing protein [Bacillus infantis]|uniref:DUF6241 domain-containing protein n=1 Tax=Bacillus infantis TaxID=324767 RepID=UPI002155C738|nr:DUF6241 domain-containing protein [Bacillus infantis]MCR6612681.1 DUF6241 domain-containing protein [Bacillus infantis]